LERRAEQKALLPEVAAEETPGVTLHMTIPQSVEGRIEATAAENKLSIVPG
jgi:hypothetical protein